MPDRKKLKKKKIDRAGMIKEQIWLHVSLYPAGRRNPAKKRCQRCRNPHSDAVFLSYGDCFPKFSTASPVAGVRKLAEQHRERMFGFIGVLRRQIGHRTSFYWL